MKKIKRIILFALLLSLLLCTTAYAGDSEARLNYVTDEAGLLSMAEYSILNDAAAQISAEYGCSVYIITVNDYTAYSSGDIYTCATEMFTGYNLGYGEDKNCVLLILSMADRDYSLIAHGAVGNAAFTDYGKDVMSDNFLDDFADNDWFGGFEDYIDYAEYMLAEAAKGTPVDIVIEPHVENHQMNIALIIAVPCLVAFIVCSVFKAQMKTVRRKRTADDYVRGNVNLHVKEDIYTHTTTTRRRIERENNSGSYSRSSSSGGSSFGGTTVRSGGFSGKSGKF